MQHERGYFLESGFIHRFLITIGTVLLVIATMQLPLSVYFQNTKPVLDWHGTKVTGEGLVLEPVERAAKGPFAGKIKKGDIAIHFDGIPLDSASIRETEFWRKIGTLNVGDTVHMDIIRGEERFTVTAVLNVTRAEFYGDQISLVVYLVNNVAPLVTVLIALIILIRRRNRLSALFAFVSFSISFYLLNIFQLNSYMPWWRDLSPYNLYASQIVLYFFFAILVHLLSVFPFERRVRGSIVLRNFLLYLPPVVFSIIVVFLVLVFEVIGEEDWLNYSIISYFFVYPVIGVVLLILSYRKAVSPAMKKVVTVLAIGITLFGIASALLLFFGYIVTDLPDEIMLWIRIVTMIMLSFSLPVCFGYAILRYGFMDVRVIVKQATVYVILSGIVIAGFMGMYLVLISYEGTFSQSDILFVSLIISGILLLAIIILKDRIQDLVSRKLFPKGYAIELKLRKLARRLLHFLEQEELLRHLCNELPAILDLRSASITQIKGGKFSLLCGAPLTEVTVSELLANPSLRRQLSDGRVVIVNAIADVPFNEYIHAMFAIDLDDGSEVIMSLGEKKSGKPFTDEETEQLRRVADHASLGWRNASVTEELKDRERIKKEVEIAQNIQMALLPHGMPRVPGLDVAAYSTPAREVGGDFYDVLPLTDGRMVISVGDVSDKGISAAMVMASAMSTLRFAAEINGTPKEMLESANRRLYYDTRKQMFVAVCTALVDPVRNTMTFTNAGLPKPLLYRDGEAYTIEWSDNGEHLPLGAKLDTYYHEQTIDLRRGDILLVYTDGVVESINESDEEFGVKRLKQSVQESNGEPCERILQRIHDDIHAFTGTQALFDDITMVCLRVE